MAVITQEYDIDLKATGWYPVVEMSQFDTGSRTIVLTVYDGEELVPLDGCVARIDGRRSDGVEFSASCTVGTESRVSFTISQEMTRAAGKHVAELVIIDAAGNTVGTQNFIFDVEPASMLRDAAASADDRTLYDQYTSSIESKFQSLSKDVNRTVEDISQAIGATSKPKVIINQSVIPNGYAFDVRMVYDPVTALVTLRVETGGVSGISTTSTYNSTLLQIPADYLPEASLIDSTNGYTLSSDNLQPEGTGHSDVSTEYLLDTSGNLIFRVILPSGNSQWRYGGTCNASWYARGGKYLGVTTIGTGGNTISVGTVTTGEPGTNASVTNSGTAKDVVLDFTIPRGASGSGSGGGSYTLPAATSTTLGGIKVGSNLSITSDGTLSATGGSGSGFDPATFTPVTIGNGATATGDQSTAVGESVASAGDYATAIGHGASTSATGATAIGCTASAQGEQSVAIGFGALATEKHTVSVGNSQNVPATYSRIVNVDTPTADHDAATKAYVDTKVASATGFDPTTADPVAIGKSASASNSGGVAIGYSAIVNVVGSVAIGSRAFSNYTNSIAIGPSARATKTTSVAIGSTATVTGSQSVAIGSNSEATEDYTFSVGQSALKRRIVYVDTPTAASDAATKNYVDTLIAALETRVAALESK